jgi:hypothetical protein
MDDPMPFETPLAAIQATSMDMTSQACCPEASQYRSVRDSPA